MSVLIVQAASAAVSCLPSLHLACGARLERPRLAAVRCRPRGREERCEVELAVVLDEDRIDVLERAVRVLVEGDVRVERVDPVGRAETERASALRARPRAGCGCREDQRSDRQRHRRKPPLPHVRPPPRCRTVTPPRSTSVHPRRAYNGPPAEWKPGACRGRAAACRERARRAAAGACRARPRSTSRRASR